MNDLLIVLAVFSGILGCLGAYGLFDAMIKWLYQSHHQTWRDIGEPIGFFWAPLHISRWSLRASTARSKAMCAWLFRTPQVIQENVRMRRYIIWYRILFIMFVCGVVAGCWVGISSTR